VWRNGRLPADNGKYGIVSGRGLSGRSEEIKGKMSACGLEMVYGRTFIILPYINVSLQKKM
jgi:hypothetical protein